MSKYIVTHLEATKETRKTKATKKHPNGRTVHVHEVVAETYDNKANAEKVAKAYKLDKSNKAVMFAKLK